MRPLKLTVNAFGPFAGKTYIDFERLGGDGIYLITGDTGSGKTSIFDAISYALYGATTNERGRNGALMRSDFASSCDKTFVELVFTEKGETYTIRRNPQYMRKKERGEGLTEEKASVLLTSPSMDKPLSKSSEVLEKIVSVTGMTADQFSRIVMLAQGKFSEFLLSPTREKEELFRTLFDTSAYRTFQDKLLSMAKEASAAGERIANEKLSAARSVLCDPESPLAKELKAAIADGTVDDEVKSLISGISDEERSSSAFHRSEAKRLIDLSTKTSGMIKAAQDRKDNLTKLERHKEKMRSEEARLQEMLELSKEDGEKKKEAQSLRQEVTELDKAVLPLFGELRKTEDEIRTSRKNLEVLVSDLSSADEKGKVLAAELESISEALKTLEGSHERQLEALDEKTKAEARSRSLSEAAGVRKKLLEKHAETEELRKEAEIIIESERKLEREGEELSSRLKDTEQRLSAHSSLDVRLQILREKEVKLRGLKQTEEELVTSEVRCRKLLDEVKELLEDVNGKNAIHMAAYTSYQSVRLALNLKDGVPCPVCGSLHHPDPCTDDHVSEDDVKAAEAALSKAKALYEERSAVAAAARGKTEALRRQYEVLLAETGRSSVAEADSDFRKESAELSAMKAERKALEDEKKAIEKAIERNSDKLRAAGLKLRDKVSEVSKAEGFLSQLESNLRSKLDSLGLDESSLGEEADKAGIHYKECVSKLERANGDVQKEKQLRSGMEQAKASISENDKLKTELEKSKAREESTIASLDKRKNTIRSSLSYSSEDEVLTLIDEKKKSACSIENVISEHERVRAESERNIALLRGQCAVLSEAISSVPEYDIEALYRDKEESDRLREEEDRLASLSDERLHSAEAALEKIEELEKEGGAAERRFRMLNELSSVAGGSLAGSERLTLETFVQARYLDRILTLANRNLSVMTDGRYRMIRSAKAQRSGKSGLDISVEDRLTGKERPASSLSGGETFKASLALALGLSEEIQSRSGAVKMDALFLDEGFGTLDEASLSSALETLSTLATTGRIIGVISHVKRLKETISKQIVVERHGNRGSTAEVVC